MAGLSFKVLGAIGLASYAAAYVCVKLRHVSYHRFKLIAVPADGLPEMPRGYSSRILLPAELAEFAIDIGAAMQAKRFAGGLKCLGTFDGNGELAGVVWLAKRAHYDDLLNVRFRLPAAAAWDTGMWLPENKRMGRAFSAVWAGIGQWMRKEGLEWTASCIADYNIASILSHGRLGSTKLGNVTVLRLGRLQLTIGARPFVHIEGRSDVPTAELRLPLQDYGKEGALSC